MNRQHAIGQAEFETTVTRRIDPGQQAGLDEFVKTELLRVVDEVFDDIQRNSGQSQLRLDRLEIDLGEINWRDYRQQMSQRLRRQLRQALDNARYTSANRRVKPADRSDRGAGSALRHFLLHGYLPRDAASADVDEPEDLLRRELESGSSGLLEFIANSPRRNSIMARVESQFSAELTASLRRRLEPASAAAAEVLPADKLPLETEQTASPADAWHRRFELALAAPGPHLLERLWDELKKTDSSTLRETLRSVARRRQRLRMLAQRLSQRQFDEMIRRLEPDDYRFLLSLFEPGHWIAALASTASAVSLQLREWILGYLLLERDRGSERQDFIRSLLLQGATSRGGLDRKTWSDFADSIEKSVRVEGPGGELARLTLTQLERLAAERDSDAGDYYRRYARLEALFAPGAKQADEAQAFADLELLSEQAPWLLMRLLRELQTGSKDWRRLSTALTGELGYRFLSIIDPVVTAASTARPLPEIDLERILGEENARAGADRIKPDRGAVAHRPAVGPLAGISAADLPLADPRARELLLLAELLTTASLAIGLTLSAPQLQTIKRQFLNTYLNETGLLSSAKTVIEEFVVSLRKHEDIDDPRRFYSRLAEALVQNSLPSTRAATRRLIEALQGIVEQMPTPESSASVEGEPPVQTEYDDEAAPAEDIHIDNAGLVLLAPWLPRLFDQLGFIQDGEFKSRACAERAVHCVQFLADGSVGSPEYRLVLNKLLCGVGPGKPIRRSIELSDDERAQLESLLSAVTQHWKALQNTSIDGLRESFLQRGGRLQRKQDAWYLAVEAKPFDMLLQQLPWSYSTIKLGWMERVIYVDWR